MNTKCKPYRILAATAILLMCSLAPAADTKYLVIPTAPPTATTCDGPDEVVSGGGRCWKDRNLGAFRVAQSLDDDRAYGDYFQWGRLSDGHQFPSSGTTPFFSLNDVPHHSKFILADKDTSYDWRFPKNDNLWQGLYGINNPCPQGFRIPTIVEWETEIASWDSDDAAGAFASPLKLTLSGYRFFFNGTILNAEFEGRYWSSTVTNNYSHNLHFFSDHAFRDVSVRANGMSVRCIKD